MNTTANNTGLRGRPLQAGLVVSLLSTILAIALLALIAYGAPGTARADWLDGHKHRYQGNLSASKEYYFGFDIQKTGKGKKKKEYVRRLSVMMPLACTSDIGTQGYVVPMSVTGKFRIKKGKVNLRNRKTNFVVPDVTAIRFKGKLNFKANFRKKKRPQGTFRADVTVNAEGLGRCTFGQLGWKARRGARVDASVPVS